MLEMFEILLALLASLMPFVIGQRYGLLRYASPIHIVSYLVIFGFFLKAIAYSIAPELAFYSNFMVDDIAVGWGYFYLTLFILTLCLGYFGGVRRNDHFGGDAARQFAQRIRSPWMLLTVGAGLTALVTVLYFQAHDSGVSLTDSSLQSFADISAAKVVKIEEESSFGNSYALIKLFYVIPAVIFVLLLYRFLERGKANHLPVIFGSGILLIFSAFIQGKRGDLLDIMIYALIALAIAGRRLNLRVLMSGLLFVIPLMATFSVISNLRMGRGRSGEYVLLSLDSFKPIITSTYFIDINIPILLTTYMKNGEYLGGLSYLYWIYGWIPRALWPEKPIVALGTYVKNDVLGIRSIGGYNPTGAGEAFMNFGWLGIVVAFALGYFFRRSEAYFLSEKGIATRYGIVMYPVILMAAVQGFLQSSFSAVAISLIAQTIVVGILCWLLIKPADAKRPMTRRPIGRAG